MGSGIAQALATKGLSVVLLDTEERLAQRGKQRIEELLGEGQQRGLFTENQVREVLDRVEPTGDWSRLGEVDLVVEAVFEDLVVKKQVFARLDEVVAPDSILATNTSSFRVEDVAAATSRPERVVGLHYFYHPAKNRLVEVVGHKSVDGEILRRAWIGQEALGQFPIASQDAPGFVVNRFFVPWLNEAVRLHEEGVSIPTVESVAKGAFGIGMGPFELMNVTGVPITLHAARSLAVGLGDFYEPTAAIASQVESGEPWPLEGKVDSKAAAWVEDRLWGVVYHVVLALVSEGVGSFDAVDLGARVGLRWSVGPAEAMNRMGLDEVARRCDAIQTRYDLNPPALLLEHQKSSRPFTIERVTVQVDDGIATLEFNRPDKLNALDPETIGQLKLRFEEVASRADVRGIVIGGLGKAFVAGADVSFFVTHMKAGKIDAIVDFAHAGQKLFRKIEQCDKPVICRLDGQALGGGAELALACHNIVATPSAIIGFPETGIGIYPGLGGTQRLARRLGKGPARSLLYTGNTLSAEDLEACRLAWRVVAPTELAATLRAAVEQAPRQPVAMPVRLPADLRQTGAFLERAQARDVIDGTLTLPGGAAVTALAKAVRRKAPLALTEVETLTALVDVVDLDAGLAAEIEGLKRIFATQDALEGLSALLERRRPKFRGV